MMRKCIIVGVIVALMCGVSVLRAQETTDDSKQEVRQGGLKIKLASIFVDDQDKALEFYTDILGFVKKHDIPVGEYKWLTVVSPGDPDGTELLLEPNANEDAKTYQKAIYDQGIPATAFFVDDIQAEYERLVDLGVKFTVTPTVAGTTTIAIFDDTCGNFIQIVQE